MTEPDEREPTRLSSAASDADPALRAALAAGRAELPSEAQLSALAAKLGPLAIPAASGATLGAWPVVAGLVAVIAVVAAVAVVALNGASPAHAPTVARADAAAPAPAVDADAAAAADADVDAAAAADADAAAAAAAAAADADADVAAPRPLRPHAVLAPAPLDAPLPLAPDLEAELSLLRAAQDALRTDAARALSLADEHARRFADGTLAQEREVVAIEALAALSRSAEARARAERFTARWPRSAHARRLAVVLGDAGL